MIKSHNKKSLILTTFFSIALTSCGMQSKNDVDVAEVKVAVTPSANLLVEAPKEILYLHNEIRSSFSEVALLNETLPSLSDFSSTLYTAIGDGGLGADLDSENYLNLYEGIKVTTNFSEVDKSSISYTITPTGVETCSDIFSFDNEKSLIRINGSKVQSLVKCHIKLSVLASSKDVDKSVSDEVEFDVTLNPTLSMYAQKDDNAFKYLKYYSGMVNVHKIASWLKNSNFQMNGTKLSYDPTVIKNHESLLNINALTGAQSIKNLDLSNTNLKDLEAITYLKLEKLDLSGTKIEPSKLAILGKIKTLRSLNVSNMHIKDIKVISDNIQNLTALNISQNEDIQDLENLQYLKNLEILNVSATGLKNLDTIGTLANIKSLNISNNDFSKMTDSDYQSLADLYNLEEINISKTHFPDVALNNYFDLQSVRKKLKKFVDANSYDVSNVYYKEECEKQFNNFNNIDKLATVSSLQFVDIHGNACNIADCYDGTKSCRKGITIGLRDTRYFNPIGMPHLKYLDISNSIISNLSNLRNSQLKTLHLFNHPIEGSDEFEKSGISMSKSACLNQLGEHNPIAKECDNLGTGREEIVEFKEPGESYLTVPENVYSISIEACSAGNGGQGGGGGQGGFSATWDYNNRAGWKTFGQCDPFKPSWCHGPSYFVGTQILGAGSFGEEGEPSIVEGGVSGLFQTNHQISSSSFKGNCEGGNGGKGGAGGGIAGGWNPKPTDPISGINGLNGENKSLNKIENYQVKPGQVLTIKVGKGGAGGPGSGPSHRGECDDKNVKCASDGEVGKSGKPGSSGYVKISWYL